jgi:thiol-disulfide isomerase/thioredoxin
MHKLLIFILGVCLLTTNHLSAQLDFKSLQYSPQKVKAGDKVEFRFDLSKESDDFVRQVELFAYSLGSEEEFSEAEISFEKKGKTVTGSLEVPKDALVVGVILRDNEYAGPKNEGKDGFLIPVTDSKGNPLAEAYAKSAVWYSSYSRSLVDTESDFKKSVTLFELAFASDAKMRDVYYANWLLSKTQSGEKPDEKETEAYLKKTEAANLKNPEALARVASAYRVLRNDDEFKRLGGIIVRDFPNSEFALGRLADDTLRAKNDLSEQFAVLDVLKKNEKGAKYYDRANQFLLISNYQYNNWENLEKVLQNSEPKFDFAELMLNIAERCLDKNMPSQAEVALNYSKRVQTHFAQDKNMPAKMNKTKFDKNRKTLTENISKTEAGLLAVKKDYAAAVKLLPGVYESTKGEHPRINEAYVLALFHTGDKNKAKEIGETAVKNTFATPEIKNVLKAIFEEKNKDAAAFKAYMNAFEGKAFEAQKKELEKKLVSEPAPDFKLKNLKGEEVSLASLKGKVVILDFWATWCGPCIASFPAMQAAQEDLAGENVEFLFVNCWENAQDKESHVKAFLEKRSLPFHVIFDLDGEVAKSYGVKGIPAKFFIDTNGVLRYKGTGFSGNKDATVLEIKALVELLKN